jgi:hypothetical protein
MKAWQLTADSPLAMRFAADVRAGHTDYADDQTWEIDFGGPEEPAFAFQTRYGGRAGLARIVPMFAFEGRTIYERMGYAERPTLSAFGTNYARITARPVTNIHVAHELWVMASHAVGGRVMFENLSGAPVTLRLELYAQVVRDEKVISMNLLGLDDGAEALHMGRIGNLNPVLLLEGATPDAHGRGPSSKLVSSVTVPPHATASLRWIHAGRLSLDDSLQTAYRWLHKVDWDAELGRTRALHDTQLDIRTGDEALDAMLAFAAQVTLRSYIGPTGSLPHPSYVSARIPARGFSPRGDGTDHGWQWAGQPAALSYLIAPSTAYLAPELAKGVIRNALATQQSDGWIDFRPGLGGQRTGTLSTPLLAGTAWQIYEITEDHAFATEVLPGLRRFFERWFESDQDKDGAPEWENTTQSGYIENPTFARFRRWAQNADISKAETPDLMACLIHEGECLLRLAQVGATADSQGAERDTHQQNIRGRIDALKAVLETMWHEQAGTYLPRDRDSDGTSGGVVLFRGKGDEAFDVKTPLTPPNRLILRVIGGKEVMPRMSVVIEGVDIAGNFVAETVQASAFAWYVGMGAAVSENVYSQVNYIKFEGLIRLFSLEVDTVDLTRHNLTQLLPLWATTVAPERAARIVASLTDANKYWRAFGLPVCPADDPAFAPNNDGGSGGVWMTWNTMIIEGLVKHGYAAEAAELFKRLANAQLRALRRDRAFREGYNSDSGDGLGDIDDLNGVLPIALYLQLIGVRVVNERKVWINRPILPLDAPVTVRQYGVEVIQSTTEASVKFSSGYQTKVRVGDGETWVAVEDHTPAPANPQPVPVASLPPKPVHSPSEQTDDTKQPRLAPITFQDTDEIAPIPPIPADLSESVLSIRVDSQKDDTQEIPIDKLDFRKRKQPSNNPGGGDDSGDTSTGTIKIPVRGPEQS